MGIDIEKLKALAEAAQKGPWVSTGNWVSTLRGNSVAECPRGDEDFIAAANPSAVLELIAQIDSGRKKWTTMAALAGEACERHDQLRAEDESLRKDAERYRWLCAGNGYFMEENGLCGHSDEKAQADAEIDAAIAQEQP